MAADHIIKLQIKEEIALLFKLKTITAMSKQQKSIERITSRRDLNSHPFYLEIILLLILLYKKTIIKMMLSDQEK